ncbi:MAG: hypothetical protein GXY61_06835 [Lentisphaerae bacterium]|nr:hypothetical protein [Lentisphaerota bacterium]
MRFRKYGAAVILSMLMLTGAQIHAQTSGELLQQGLYAEEIEGNLPEAIVYYEKVMSDASAPAKHKAQALFHQGVCYIRLDDEAGAQAVLNRLIYDYADQTAVLEKAKPLLDKISIFDPAALMPADTLAYVELGSPAKALELLRKRLESDSLDDFAKIDIEDGQWPDNVDELPKEVIMAILAAPGIVAELGKMETLALGVCDIGPENETPSFIAVVDPGESDALRGTLVAALGLTGRPTGELEGMPVMQIPDGPSIAYDTKIILVAYPAERLEWSIKQYKGKSSEPSLATESASFKRLDKQARRKNLVTLWGDIDGLYKAIQKTVPDLPPEVRLIASIANLASMDDLVMTAAIKDDGAGITATLNLNDGMQNLIYEMIKTPTLDRAGMEAVPSSAIALASVAPADANAAQVQQLRMLIQNALEEEIPSAFFENIKQIDLFLLPGYSTALEGMPFRPGLAIACKDTGPVLETLDMLLAKSPEPLPLLIRDTGSFILIGLEQSVVDDAGNALAKHESVNDGGVLKQAISDHVGSTEKLILWNAGGIMEIIVDQAIKDSDLDAEEAAQAREVLDQLAALMEATSFALYTDEQPQSLSLSFELKGIPPLTELMTTLQSVQTVMDEISERKLEEQIRIEQEERAARFAKLLPAKVGAVRAELVPVIDGQADAAWNAAVANPVSKKVAAYSDVIDAPVPGSVFAAEFKMLWDADNLYYLLDVTDNTPNHDPELEWYLNDSVALYIDATDAKQNVLGPTDYWYVFLWDESDPTLTECEHEKMDGVKYAFKKTEKGYCIEAAFPWPTLETPAPGVGTVIGMDVIVNDNQSGSGRNAMIGWQDDTDNAWQYPNLWGRAVLEGQ